jgi:hypothetical protein
VVLAVPVLNGLDHLAAAMVLVKGWEPVDLREMGAEAMAVIPLTPALEMEGLVAHRAAVLVEPVLMAGLDLVDLQEMGAEAMAVLPLTPALEMVGMEAHRATVLVEPVLMAGLDLVVLQEMGE